MTINKAVILLVLFFSAFSCAAQISMSESLNRQIQFLNGKRPSFRGEPVTTDPQDTVYNISDGDMPTGTTYQLTKSTDGYLTVSMSKDYSSFTEAKAEMSNLVQVIKILYPNLILASDKENTNKDKPSDHVTYVAKNSENVFIATFNIQKPDGDQYKLTSRLQQSWKPIK